MTRSPEARTTTCCLAAPSNDTLHGDGGNDKIYGDAGDDTIDGGAGNDTLDGGAGNDKLTGGGGNDVLIYRGEGADSITDFVHASGARIEVTTGFSDFDDLMAAATQNGADTVIDFGGGNTLTLLGVDKTDLTTADFLIPGSAGVVILGDKKNNTIDGTHTVGTQPFASAGDDTINGFAATT